MCVLSQAGRRKFGLSFRHVRGDTPLFVKLLLVVNPAASSVSPRVQVLVQRALADHHEVRLAETTRRDHATRLAEDAARRGLDAVVVLGGDGTVNEVANGLAGSSTAMIPLPGGSTNVFCRTLHLPDDPLEAVQVSIAAMSQQLLKPVGLGRVNGRYFLFHTGIGFDAAVVEQVERSGDLKRYLNHPLFVWAAVKTWVRHFDRRRPALTVETAPNRSDAHHQVPATPDVVENAFFTICLNTDPYTYLGNLPLRIAPEATLDSRLATVTLTSLRSGHLLGLVADALRPPPGLRTGPHVEVRTDVGTSLIRARRPVPIQVDGDFIGSADEIELSHHGDALRLLRTDLLRP